MEDVVINSSIVQSNNPFDMYICATNRYTVAERSLAILKINISSSKVNLKGGYN